MIDITLKTDIEQLKTDVISLKIKVMRMEDLLKSFPDPNDYFSDELEDDQLLMKAAKVASKYDKLSSSLLQRQLSISFARAQRLMSALYKEGLIEDQIGSQPREVCLDKVREYLKKHQDTGKEFNPNQVDEYFFKVLKFIKDKETITKTKISEYLKTGYARTARLVDELEEAGLLFAPGTGEEYEVNLKKIRKLIKK